MWLRNDLRLADNPALHAAATSKRPLVCVYIYNDEPSPAGKKHGPRSLGAAARWWLHGSLQALDEALAKHGGRLTILTGAAADILPNLAANLKAAAVYWNRRYDAPGRALDATLETTLQQRGIEVTTFNGHLLNEPWTLKNQSGKPFRVFTAYWRAVLKQDAPEPPLKAPRKLRFHATPRQFKLKPVALASLGLEPKKPDWAAGLRHAWRRPDESSAQAHLQRFLKKTLSEYSTDRDRPDRLGTSRLSPYLCFGNISARQVWHTALETTRKHPTPESSASQRSFSPKSVGANSTTRSSTITPTWPNVTSSPASILCAGE